MSRSSIAVRWLLPLAALLAAVCGAAGFAGAAATVDPEPYFRQADYGALKLSPSGRYIGALIPVKGRRGLAVIDLDARTSHVASAMDGEDIVAFDWVNDGRLVFSVADLQVGSGEQHGRKLYAVNRDGSFFRRLAPAARGQVNRSQRVYRYVRVLAMLDDGSDDILVVANEPNARLPSVYRMDTTTGRKTLKSYDAPGPVVRWIADTKGAVRAAVTDEQTLASRVYWRPADDAAWVELAAFRLGAARFEPIAFDGDGSLIVWSNLGRDTAAIYRYDTAKRALGAELAADPQADLTGGLVFDRDRNRLAGVAYDAALPAVAWFANAAKIRAPVLMAYGAQDLRVPIVHGQKMRDALVAQGTPVEWVVYAEEGHGFLLERNRMDYYRRVARFLAAHNPPD